MRNRVVWSAVAVLLCVGVRWAGAQAPVGTDSGDAPPAFEAPADASGPDEAFAWLEDDLAWLGDDAMPAPPGEGAGGGTGGPAGFGRGPMMRGGPGMGPGMHGGPGAGRGPMGRGPRGMGPGPGARIFAQLDLSDAQREKLADIRERQMRADIQTRADLATGMLDMRKLMRAEKPDKAAIDRQIDRLSALRATQQKARVGSMLEARAVLTPEQQKKAHELRARGPMGPRGGAGPRGRSDDSRDVETPKR